MNHLSNSGKEIKKDSDVPESPKVAASEIGISPNRFNGVVGPHGDDPKSKNQYIAERSGKACRRA